MTDREKVIKGLECCQECDGYTCRNLCPYHDKNESENQTTCTCRLAHDALALLKAQEPRVMTVSEIGALSNGDVVWVEFTDGRLLPMMVEDGCLMRWRFLWRICEDAFLDDDYKARAWTSRPTDEQRKATPWN